MAVLPRDNDDDDEKLKSASVTRQFSSATCIVLLKASMPINDQNGTFQVVKGTQDQQMRLLSEYIQPHYISGTLLIDTAPRCDQVVDFGYGIIDHLRDGAVYSVSGKNETKMFLVISQTKLGRF